MIERKTALKQLKLLDEKARSMRLAAEGWKNDFQILVAIMLSARTLDETVIRVCEKLFSQYPDAKTISSLQMSEVRSQISEINFFQNKAKYLSLMSKRIIEEFNGKVPNTIPELITLAGVGRKTANVFLGVKGGDHIGVDTHVTYISNYLGWTKSNKPEVIERDLEELFPKSQWRKISHILIRFGKTHTSKREKDSLLEEVLEATSRRTE